MRLGHLSIATSLLALATALVVPAPGEGGGDAIAGHHKSKSKKKSRGKKSYFSGHGVDKDELRTDAVPKPSGNLWLYSPNFREEVKVNIHNTTSKFLK